VRADPLAPGRLLQFLLDCAGRYDESEAEYRRLLTLSGDPALTEYFWLRRAMATEGSQAVKVKLRRYLALNDHFMPIHGDVLERFEDRPAVLKLVRAATEDPFYQDSSHMAGLSHLAAFMGDDELAFDCLRRALGGQFQVQLPDLWHPQFRSVRQMPAFKDLVRDLGLYDYWRASGRWGDFVRPVGEDDFEVIG